MDNWNLCVKNALFYQIHVYAHIISIQLKVNSQLNTWLSRRKMLIFSLHLGIFLFTFTNVLCNDSCDLNTCKCFRASITCFSQELFSVPLFTWRERKSTKYVDLRRCGLYEPPLWSATEWPSLRVGFILQTLIALRLKWGEQCPHS